MICIFFESVVIFSGLHGTGVGVAVGVGVIAGVGDGLGVRVGVGSVEIPVISTSSIYQPGPPPP